MKRFFAFSVLLVIVMVIAIPALVIRFFQAEESHLWGKKEMVFRGEDVSIRVYLHEQNKTVEMNLEDYVKGVVAAEMPAEFELEALKSQAVAARTYAVKNMKNFGGSGLAEQPGADVSTDHRQNQAWLSEEKMKSRWGSNYEKYWKKISQAVEGTRGLVLTYNGEFIQAVFHSTSGDKTASAKEVWGYEYPYLISVPCTWDQKAPRYYDTKEIALADIEKALGSDAGVVAAATTGNGAVTQLLAVSESGRVDKMRIGSKTFSGLELREKLDLRSTNFSVELKGDKMMFKTVGYGHGVGLCQYGANGMAKEGRSFRDILTYYYQGVALKNIFGS